MDLLTLSLGLLIIFLIFLSRKYQYWSKRGVNGPKPIFLFGNNLSKAFRRTPDLEVEWMNKYGKIYGVYHGTKPSLTVIDNEAIKQIMIKDFHHFVNRRVPNSYHHIWNQNLFLSESENWKRIRSITSPTFTTGKLKSMYSLMEKCIEKLLNHFSSITSNGAQTLDVKKVISGFTIDVIATTSFATEINSIHNQNNVDPFVQNGLKMFSINPFRIFAAFTFPRFLLKIMNITTVFNDSAFNFFVQLAQQIIRKRNAEKFNRNDLVQLLMNASVSEKDLQTLSYSRLAASIDENNEKDHKEVQTEGKIKKTLNENEIVAQCILFFVAGFETTASTISHCLYELALNENVQEKLYNELKKLDDDNISKQTDEYYNTVMTELPYLDAVVKETLRKYPPLIRTERMVDTDGYSIGGIQLFKNQEIEVPIFAVHHCSDYYPEPELFNPERFMPENKHLLKPYTYMPFGLGPRNCIGMRFAYQEIKLMLSKVIPMYRFDRCNETDVPLKFMVGSLLLSTRNIKVKITKR